MRTSRSILGTAVAALAAAGTLMSAPPGAAAESPAVAEVSPHGAQTIDTSARPAPGGSTT
ncbi:MULTISPECIES: hypothetical protein [Streptomyces]|uniref:hypothetical protein n=1 Tax=Streptomyces TaxID=1883 RepID=UPI001FE8F0B3|nr:hypothetical protein [Streptomyces glaucescens]